MGVDLKKLKEVAEGGPPDQVVGVDRGYLAQIFAMLDEQKKANLFPSRAALLTHKAPEIVRQ